MGPKRKAYGGSPGESKSRREKALMSLSDNLELLNMLDSGESASEVARHHGKN